MQLRRKPTNAQRSELGYRSGLEETIAQSLLDAGVPFEYEETFIEYLRPAKWSKYRPDFVITRPDQSQIIVETKGRFLTADRQKHLLVKQQHPSLDIRFVFSRSAERISKQSKTTYAMWCEKNGFIFADKSIPPAWLQPKG
jgi:hypothetical protein